MVIFYSHVSLPEGFLSGGTPQSSIEKQDVPINHPAIGYPHEGKPRNHGKSSSVNHGKPCNLKVW